MIKIVQMCDRCGRDRTLSVPAENQKNGWRDIDYRSTTKTLCNVCMGELLEWIAKG